jgi:hypothetical protein
MNERMQELAEQAGYKPLPGFDFANSLQEVFLSKFAKLIVRECAHEISILDAEPVSHKSAAMILLKHFGIEE